ncbi:trehalose-phosphatase [Martelella alba]|uniref:trehalose-phosphatase n=1 Tax=Martelella alba TaxID=2590451 RepID=UPI0027D33AA8|nr:trehalose-phosphatase [Martelella alba]
MDIKLRRINKGEAIAVFMREALFEDHKPVFIGDDLTDETGFAIASQRNGFSVKVDSGETCARWSLSDVASVHCWIDNILNNGQTSDVFTERRESHESLNCHI